MENSVGILITLEGKKEEIKSEQEKQTGGKNPDITIKKVTGEKIEEIKDDND